MAPDRLYYRYRKGADPERMTLEQLARLLRSLFLELDREGWFQARMGKDCVDDPVDIGAYVLEELGWSAYPLADAIQNAAEDELFTIAEFLFDNVAKPVESSFHSWNACGLHVQSADAQAGQSEFRDRLNRLLGRYERPHLIREDGEIWEATPSGLEEQEPELTGDPTIDERVRSAQTGFRRHGASTDDKRHAIKDLADVLEHLRATIGTGLPSADENRLFEIANKFGIRHLNPSQETNYDSEIWLDYMYYANLNAIMTATRLIVRGEGESWSG